MHLIRNEISDDQSGNFFAMDIISLASYLRACIEQWAHFGLNACEARSVNNDN